MNRDPFEQPAVPFNPRHSDDPMHRIARQAENRAARNGRTEAEQHAAGRKAMALRKMLLADGKEPNSEKIISAVAGDFPRG